MYAYNGQNTGTCYDNSAQFAGPVVSRVCTSFAFSLNHKFFDADGDDLYLSFAEPWDSTSIWPASPISYDATYSFMHPFPGKALHASNKPASIHYPSGDIQFTSFTAADVVHVVKASSYRNGLLLSEVYRDYLVKLVSCPPSPSIPPISNTPPSSVFRDSLLAAPATLPSPGYKAVMAGDSLSFSIVSNDIQFLPGFINQSNFLFPHGEQFGKNFANTILGCPYPPCAVLDTIQPNAPPPVSVYFGNYWKGTYGVATTMRWKTDSIHSKIDGRLYNFHFNIIDNWCPDPGANDQTFSIEVFEKPDNHITGTVFLDTNGNGVKDLSEQAIPNILVVQNPNLFMYNTETNGQYSLGCYQDTVQVSIVLPKYHQITTPASGSHTVVPAGQGNTYANRDFGIKPIPGIRDLSIDIQAWPFPRPGYPFLYALTCRNTGTEAMSGSVSMTFDSVLSYVSATPTPSSTGSTITWNFSNLLPGKSNNLVCNFKVDSTASVTSKIWAYAKVEPIAGDTMPGDNTDSVSSIILNSFDPNNKTYLPQAYYKEDSNYVLLSSVKAGLAIEYIIHFQNTGTAPAVNVRIEDELLSSLNPETFEFISSSHYPVTYEVRGKKVTCFLNGINLPDSASNFAQSCGFVKFRIMADTGLIDKDTIYNNALIFFDFNSPVIATSKLGIKAGSIVVIPGIFQENFDVNADDFHLFPNPTDGLLNINFSGEITGPASIELYDISGSLRMSKAMSLTGGSGNTMTIDLNGQPGGLYFVRITTGSTSRAVKLVISK